MKHLWDIFRNINEFVRLSDTKAGLVLAFAGGAVVFLAGKADVVHDIILTHGTNAWGWSLYVIFYGYMLSLLWTVACAFVAIRPSLGSSPKRSTIYFKHIWEDYQHDHERYANAMATLDDPALEKELAHQICVNAGIATRKFVWIGRAINALAITGVFWVATVFLILLLGGASVTK